MLEQHGMGRMHSKHNEWRCLNIHPSALKLAILQLRMEAWNALLVTVAGIPCLGWHRSVHYDDAKLTHYL